MKIFAVSDIHGCATALISSLCEAGFDPKNSEHLLIVLGDLFDRGSENRRVLEYLSGVKNKILIRGNHEDILLESLTSGAVTNLQFVNGTHVTLAEFFSYYHGESLLNIIDSSQRRVAEKLIGLIESMYDYFETEGYIFVHGWLPDDAQEKDFRYATSAKWNNARWLRWHTRYPNFDIPDNKTLVVGHTPCYYASMFDRSRSDYDCSIFYGHNLVAIDGAAVSKGRVNVFVTQDEVYLPVTHELCVEAEELNTYARGELTCCVLPFEGEAREIRVGDKLRLKNTDTNSLTFNVTALRLCEDYDTFVKEGFFYNALNSASLLGRAKAAINSRLGVLLLVIS
ncbi:MAG: metallophosphoesterase [Clostridia bacterium]|nr:metallophosphoesterase [Clostridia bacterium]